MSTVNPEFVERYQIEFEKNPRSRIFAPLAEAYRQMGLIDEALKVCANGVQNHPDFAGGRVAYARQFYNDEVLGLNNAIQKVPGVFIARIAGITAREYFTAEPEAQKPPEVRF